MGRLLPEVSRHRISRTTAGRQRTARRCRGRAEEGGILRALAAPDEWRWTDDQGVQRVVRADELRSALASSVLAPSTLVWREGMSGWVPAFTVPELGASEGPGAVSEPLTDGTTDIGPAPRVDPPSLVRASLVVPNEPERGSKLDTGRPTPTELLREAARGERSDDGSPAPRPAAGQSAGGSALKIGAAPKPIAQAARPGAGKVESATSPSKANGRPTGPAWRKGELGKTKGDEELTLVAEAGDPFKVKASGEAGPTGGGPGAAKPATAEAPKAQGRVAASLATRRPVTHTAVLTPNEPPKPMAGKMPSTVPPPPTPLGAGRNASSVPPAPVPKRSPTVPPPPQKVGPSADPRGFRATAIRGSGTGIPSAGRGGTQVSVPVPPRVPGPARPAFNIVENTSTDSTGVLPLSGKYAAEPKAERAPAPSFIEGAPAFAERTPSFPDGGVHTQSSSSQGAEAAEGARAPMRSQPPPGEGYAQGGYAPSGYGPPYSPGMPASALASYPPAPMPMGMDPRVSAPRLEAEARGSAGMAPPRFPMRSEPPAAPVIVTESPYSEPPPPYSAPPVPFAMAEPSMGELRATGAMPLVNPKRSYPAAPAGPTEPDPLEPTEQPPDAFAPGSAKVGDPVVVPMSSLFGAGGILIAMAIMAFFVGRCSVAPGPASPPARAALAALPRLALAALPAAPKPCWMAKQPVRWAPTVLQSVPVDVTPTASGVVVAYAREAREPATVEVDFAAGTFNDKAADKREEDIVRVFAPRDGSALLATTKSDSGPLAPYVFAPRAAPFVIGVAGRGTPSPSVALADKPDGAPTTLWPVPPVEEDKGLEAARVLAVGPASHALVFRRSGNILGGFLGEGHRAEGGLGVIAGSGGSVGKPALGTNRREIAVVFADKSKADSPWEIRVGHAPLGQVPRETMIVPLPKGGPGGDAFAPDVAGTPDGRWVLVWTEGKTGGYAVRAQTFGADWKPLGDPIAISPPAGNFGQAVVGAAGNYVTTMFLSKGSSGSYELWGAVLQCGS